MRQISQPLRWVRFTILLISGRFVHFSFATSHSIFFPTPARLASVPVSTNSVNGPETLKLELADSSPLQAARKSPMRPCFERGIAFGGTGNSSCLDFGIIRGFPP